MRQDKVNITQDKTILHNPRQSRQDNTRQDKTAYDKTRQANTIYDTTRQDNII